jgi:hypothetical protein
LVGAPKRERSPWAHGNRYNVLDGVVAGKRTAPPPERTRDVVMDIDPVAPVQLGASPANGNGHNVMEDAAPGKRRAPPPQRTSDVVSGIVQGVPVPSVQASGWPFAERS